MCSMTSRGRLPMTCGARRSSTCWTSFQTRRRGTTIVIGICTGGGAYMSVPRLHWSGRRCAWPLPLGEAGSLSGRRRLPNCCSVLKPSTLKKYEKAHWIEKTGLSPHHFLYAIIGAPSSGKTLTPQPTFSVCLFLTTRIGYFYIYIH